MHDPTKPQLGAVDSALSRIHELQKLGVKIPAFELSDETRNLFGSLAKRQSAFLTAARANWPSVTAFEQFAATSQRITQIASRFGELNFQPAIDGLSRLSSIIRDVATQYGPTISKLALANREAERLKKTGWLPHYTTPPDLIDECGDDTAMLKERLDAYYRNGWDSVARELLHNLDGYAINEESKTTFRESLSAHGAGFYRCVCRVLFPEIERVTRIELLSNSRGPITSQKELREFAGGLGLSETKLQGFLGFELYSRLERHLYAHAGTDLSEFENDPVPNRHCAIHGLVSYTTFQNSLNMIFMTDYIFQVIHATKQAQRAAA